MASASSTRGTVVRLIGLPNSALARWLRSRSDSRLRGSPVWATRSHARPTTTALSRGGKRGLAPPAGLVGERELPVTPALAPAAHGVGVQVNAGPGLDVRERGDVVQQQGQACALPQVTGRGAGADELVCLGEELGRKGRAVQRSGAGHGRCPRATSQEGSMCHTPTVTAERCSATLHVFAVRTTKYEALQFLAYWQGPHFQGVGWDDHLAPHR